MSIEVLSANPFSDKYALQSAMWHDLTFDPRDDRATASNELSDEEAPWDTLLTAPTKSALFYDASYNPRDIRAIAPDKLNNKEAYLETILTAPMKSALIYDASYDPRNNRVTISDDPYETHALCETLSSAPTRSALIYDAKYDPRAGKASLADEDNNLVGTWPEFNEIPILTWSPPSSRTSSCSLSSLDTISTAPTSHGTPDPITWRNTDLMYLLSVLKPLELMNNQLVFIPSLDDLHKATYPIHLQLHKKVTSIPPGFQAYAKKGLLLAESAKMCDSPTSARRSLASSLLSSSYAVSAAVDKYNVLWTLHGITNPSLVSIQRAILAMSEVPNSEWMQRLQQLRGWAADGNHVEGVGEYCTVEARLEYYFLEVGKGCLEEWTGVVGVALKMTEERKKASAKVYADAAAYLGRAYEELRG
jgi:hypothetical protein